MSQPKCDRLVEVHGTDFQRVTERQCLTRTGEVVRLLLERQASLSVEPPSDENRRLPVGQDSPQRAQLHSRYGNTLMCQDQGLQLGVRWMPCAFSDPGGLTDSMPRCLVQNDLNIRADEEFLTISPPSNGTSSCSQLPTLLHLSVSGNALPGSRERLGRKLSPHSKQQSCIYQLEFLKPETGGLGFTLMGGVNGSPLRVKDISPRSLVALDGRLRVGDVLLEVNGFIVSGQRHSKVLEILRAAEGMVQLTVHRGGLAVAGPEPEHDHPGITAETDAKEEMTERRVVGRFSENLGKDNPNSSYPPLCMPARAQEAHDRNTSLSVPPDTAGRQHKDHADEWSSEDEEGEGDGDEDSSRPNSLLTERPIVSEETLSSLAMISPPESSQYSGARLRALIQNLQHQLDQQDLIKEFMALEHLRPADSCLVGTAPENREKNRYRDILPYDGTRVPVGEQQEYINASYIRISAGPGEQLCYICTQGPLPGTQACFWQMVWENRSGVIAMVTREVERGRVKCHRYWPGKLHEAQDAGCYQLILDSYQRQDYFDIRMIKMVEKESGDVHLVSHLKFTAWPDHGVPCSCHQLVRFVRFMRAVHCTGPITVHCSAGVGRTGVLICTDVILALIAKDLSINVSSIVREMRLQRHGMVQTKEQYLFCYKVWLDVLQNIPALCGTQWLQEKAS